MSDFIDDKVSVINNAREKAIVSVKDYAKPQIISSMLEIFISIVLILGVQLITFGFNLDAMLHWKFWVRTACLSVAIFMLYRAVINGRFHKTSQRDNVVSIRNEYNDKNKLKDLGMKEWLKKVFNLQTKIDTYVGKQNAKIFKLENKVIKTYSPKKKVKLEEKIEVLKQTITNDFIIANIDKIKIKYYIVFYSDFTSENSLTNGKLSTRDNYNGEFNKSSFKKIWMYVASSVLLGVSTFLLEDYSAASILVSICSTAFMVTTRVMSALMEAPIIYDKTITASMLGRIEVLDEYFKYKAEHPTVTKIEHEVNEAREKMRDEIRLEVRKELLAELEPKYQKKLDEEIALVKEIANNIENQKNYM